MCVGNSAPSIPPPPPPPPPPAPVPKRADPQTKQARADERKRVQQLAGTASLNATTPQGLTEPANTNAKKALGA